MDETIPRLGKKPRSYDESLDEPAELIEQEPVEFEHDIPATGNEPVERVDENREPEAPAFED